MPTSNVSKPEPSKVPVVIAPTWNGVRPSVMR